MVFKEWEAILSDCLRDCVQLQPIYRWTPVLLYSNQRDSITHPCLQLRSSSKFLPDPSVTVSNEQSAGTRPTTQQAAAYLHCRRGVDLECFWSVES